MTPLAVTKRGRAGEGARVKQQLETMARRLAEGSAPRGAGAAREPDLPHYFLLLRLQYALQLLLGSRLVRVAVVGGGKTVRHRSPEMQRVEIAGEIEGEIEGE
jgi:hypothetical protein